MENMSVIFPDYPSWQIELLVKSLLLSKAAAQWLPPEHFQAG